MCEGCQGEDCQCHECRSDHDIDSDDDDMEIDASMVPDLIIA